MKRIKRIFRSFLSFLILFLLSQQVKHTKGQHVVEQHVDCLCIQKACKFEFEFEFEFANLGQIRFEMKKKQICTPFVISYHTFSVYSVEQI